MIEALIGFGAGFFGVILATILVKLYLKWEDRKFAKQLEKDIEEWLAITEETKPPVSDPPESPDKPL